MTSPFLVSEARIIRMEQALRCVPLDVEARRLRAYRDARIEAIEPGDDAEAVRRAEIFRTRIAYGLGPRPDRRPIAVSFRSAIR